MPLEVIKSAYLTTTEAGARLGVCERTVRLWVASGRLKGGLLRKRLVIHTGEVDRVLAEQHLHEAVAVTA